MANAPTAEQKRYWARVVALDCLVTGQPATLHHVHGGSIVERGFPRTFGRKVSHWLVIPLGWNLHLGPRGIDGGPSKPSVEEWEAEHGRQADLVDEVIRRLGVPVWDLARAEEKGMVPRRVA